jgi:uncharacterized repeat protein (TIGR02543 family)
MFITEVKMIKFWRFLSVSIVLAVCVGLMMVPMALPSAVSADPGDEWAYEIEPNTTSASASSSFSVNITAVQWDTGESDGWEAYVRYDTTYLSVTGITIPSTLPPPNNLAPDKYLAPGAGIYGLTTNPGYNNTEGILYVGYSPQAATPKLNETFWFATIDFATTAAEGVTSIYFVDIDPGHITEILLGAMEVQNWTKFVNGTVMVGAPSLQVCVDPVGAGNVTADGTPLVMTAGCNTTSWAWDANVSLAASPATNYAFVNWTGDLTGNTTPDNITMDANKNVTAHFVAVVPIISPDPDNLTFTADVGGANPSNQTLDIYNIGAGILNWTASITYAGATGWLNMSPMSGDNLSNGEYNRTWVAVNITGLTKGTYHATINITGSSVEVPVTLSLGAPAISVKPTSLTFTTDGGEDPPSQALQVWNSGSGTLNWSLSDNAAWLSENPTTGSSTGADDKTSVAVSVDATGMEVGDYSATITIADPAASNTPQTVSVTLHIVSVMPEMPVTPASVSASGLSITPQQVQPGREVTISVNVANTGGETGSYNAVLYINGAVENSQSVSVAGGTSKNVIFTVTKSKAGVYDVSVAGQSGQFEVVGGGGWFAGGLGTGGIIAIVVVVIVLIVAVIFILRGATRPE